VTSTGSPPVSPALRRKLGITSSRKWKNERKRSDCTVVEPLCVFLWLSCLSFIFSFAHRAHTVSYSQPLMRQTRVSGSVRIFLPNSEILVTWVLFISSYVVIVR
jgi:hypothetical protein